MESSFLDHFRSPRNVGDLDEADGRAEVENPVCGDRLRLSLRLEGERVSELAYRVRGCSGAIACASVMTELARGLSLGEARGIDRGTIERALADLPALKRHGADLAAEGLREALAEASRKRQEKSG